MVINAKSVFHYLSRRMYVENVPKRDSEAVPRDIFFVPKGDNAQRCQMEPYEDRNLVIGQAVGY